MKITAQVTFSKYTNREFLIQAFFSKSDFSPKNRLRIVDDETAFIQLEFEDNLPLSIIKAISHCKINSMDNLESSNIEALMRAYEGSQTNHTLAELEDDKVDDESTEVASDVTEDVQDDEPDSVSADEPILVDEETEPQVEDAEPQVEDAEVIMTEEETSSVEDVDDDAKVVITDAQDETQTEEDDEPKDVVAIPEKALKKRRYGRVTPSEEDYLDIPDLDRIAGEVTSFTQFVTNVGKWLNLPEDSIDYFVKITAELSTIGVEGYEIRNEDVKRVNRNMEKPDYRRVKLGKQVSSLLETHNIFSTFHPFLCTVMKYAKKSYKAEADVQDSADQDCEGEHQKYDKSTIDDEVKTTEKINYLNCENFVQILKSIDENAPVDEKVKELLSKMGLDKKSKNLYNNTCQIVKAAFSMESIDSVDQVLNVAGVDTGTKNGMQIKIKLSEWINDYNKENHVKRMKIIAFLRELKAIFTSE